MATQKNRTCVVCGTQYRYCPTCREFAGLPSWYTTFDNENCRELFSITSDLANGDITEAEARTAFEKCDLSYKHILKKSILDAIEKVSKTEKIVKKISDDEKQKVFE